MPLARGSIIYLFILNKKIKNFFCFLYQKIFFLHFILFWAFLRKSQKEAQNECSIIQRPYLGYITSSMGGYWWNCTHPRYKSPPPLPRMSPSIPERPCVSAEQGLFHNIDSTVTYEGRVVCTCACVYMCACMYVCACVFMSEYASLCVCVCLCLSALECRFVWVWVHLALSVCSVLHVSAYHVRL